MGYYDSYQPHSIFNWWFKDDVEAGKKVSVRDLVRGMDIVSGNDATMALAEYLQVHLKLLPS